MNDSLGIWEPLSPREVGVLFEAFEPPWWIAGGWALDLFLGWQTRHHKDIDVEIPRCAVGRVAGFLDGWDLRKASGGVLEPWDGTSAVPEPVNSLWCRERDDEPWRLQIMLALTMEDRWIYRRDSRIDRELADMIRRTSTGIPYLAPEIQLLFKSKDVRRKDEADFQAVLDFLNHSQRAWLVAALQLNSPGHQWETHLSDPDGSN